MNGVKEAIDLAEDEFVVSRIAGKKRDAEKNTWCYLIEWDGYDLTENTWEEEGNVYSEKTIQDFVTAYKRQNKCKNLPTHKKMLLNNTYDPDTQLYHKPLKSLVRAVKTVTKTTTTVESFKKRARDLIETETELVTISKPLKEARVALQNLELESRAEFEEKMKAVKDSVKVEHPLIRSANNQLTKNKFPIHTFKDLKVKTTVVNEVDEGLPTDFIYVDQLKYTDPVQPPDPDFLPGCPCKNTNCSDGCHDVIAYDKHGKLQINQGTAIYECNQACECSLNCKNRIVQRGRKISLQVFKTKGKGWGVRSSQSITRGTFIEEYIGEVIRVEEGDARGAIYDTLGCSYLFDMDFAQSEWPTKYVIDSYTIGNISRFFNHSCSPNLDVYAVFYDSADNQMHRLAFFAKRDIRKGEELCFDYNGRRDVTEDEQGDNASRYACHCDSAECRKWIYH